MTQILQSLHPDSLIKGDVKLAGTPLADVPHIYGLYDWRVALPRTVVREGWIISENFGSFINSDSAHSQKCAAVEWGRQQQSFDGPSHQQMAWLNTETYPSWAPTDRPTKNSAQAAYELGRKRGVRWDSRSHEYQYELEGLAWYRGVVAELRSRGLKVGAYDPCPDWCEQTPGLCYYVASMLDFALVPLYVHKGYDKPNGPLYPTAWYANQWARRIARYRQNLPGVEIIGIGWPMLDLKGNPGTNRIALSESYRKVQALCAKNEGIDLVLWDDPKTQDQLKDAVDTLAVWRGML